MQPNMHARYSPNSTTICAIFLAQKCGLVLYLAWKRGSNLTKKIFGNKSFYLFEGVLKELDFLFFLKAQPNWPIAQKKKKKTLNFGMYACMHDGFLHPQLINVDCNRYNLLGVYDTCNYLHALKAFI
jgi:uncharacterized membrane protein YhfC